MRTTIALIATALLFFPGCRDEKSSSGSSESLGSSGVLDRSLRETMYCNRAGKPD